MSNTQTIKFEIIKKGRSFFSGKLNSKYPAKLFIDTLSENLAIGHHELFVTDESIRSQYGTQLKFKMSSKTEETKEKVFIKSDIYNQHLVDAARKLGGKWIDGAWMFSAIVEDEVEDLDAVFNSELITIEIYCETGCFGSRHKPLNFCGQEIAKVSGKSYEGKLSNGVSLIEGEIIGGGTNKNWCVRVYADTKIRLQIPEKVLEEYAAEETEWTITKI